MKDLLGVPYMVHGRGMEGLDCWGLAIEVMKRYGVKLPDLWYQDSTSRESIRGSIVAEADFERIDHVDEPCIVTLQNHCCVNHVAVYIGGGNIIHSTEKRGVVIEPLRRYKSRIEGIYKVSNH